MGRGIAVGKLSLRRYLSSHRRVVDPPTSYTSCPGAGLSPRHTSLYCCTRLCLYPNLLLNDPDSVTAAHRHDNLLIWQSLRSTIWSTLAAHESRYKQCPQKYPSPSLESAANFPEALITRSCTMSSLGTRYVVRATPGCLDPDVFCAKGDGTIEPPADRWSHAEWYGTCMCIIDCNEI